jgi:hypothetical protein
MGMLGMIIYIPKMTTFVDIEGRGGLNSPYVIWWALGDRSVTSMSPFLTLSCAFSFRLSSLAARQ